MSEVADHRFDYLSTLCDRVREDVYLAFVRVAADLETRIGFLLARIGAPQMAPVHPGGVK